MCGKFVDAGNKRLVMIDLICVSGHDNRHADDYNRYIWNRSIVVLQV